MSSLERAARLVAQARRRLAVSRAAELAATAALLGACAAAAALLVARHALGVAAHPAWVLVPVAVGLAGLAAGLARPPATARAALALDRAAGTHEAFVSALTAVDAHPAFRELAAAQGLRVVADRPAGRLVPLRVPRRAAPALAAVALVAALVAVGGGDADAGPRSAGPSIGVPATGAASGAAASGVPGAGAVPTQTVEPGGAAAAERLPAASDAEVLRLATELAARGLEAAAQALAALRAGDRETAERLLREALTAPGERTGGAGGAAGGAAGAAAGQAVAPGAWSAGAWPLRYDREVRAWLRRQAAGTEVR